MLGQARLLAAAAVVWAAAAAPLAAQTTLRSADTHPADYPTVQAVQRMSVLLEQRTDGRLRIDVLHSSQLGEEKVTIEQTRHGVIDLNRVNLALLNNLAPETQVPALPFLFRSIAHMRRVMDGPIGDEILAALAPHGLVGLAFYDSGARSLYTAQRPVRAVADMKGLRIRVQQSDLFIAMINALGAEAVALPYGEVEAALHAGVIDGAENNFPSYESSRHFAAARHYALTEHTMAPEALVMSRRSYDRLSDADKAAMRAAAKESVGRMRELWDAREQAARAAVEAKGAQIIAVDKQPFIDAMRPVLDRFANAPRLQDLARRIQATP